MNNLKIEFVSVPRKRFTDMLIRELGLPADVFLKDIAAEVIEDVFTDPHKLVPRKDVVMRVLSEEFPETEDGKTLPQFQIKGE